MRSGKWTSVFTLTALIAAGLAILPCSNARAERPKVIAVVELTADGVEATAASLSRLTDAVYAAATSAPHDRFSVISREKLASVLASTTSAPAPLAADRIGAAAGADLVFSGKLRRKGDAAFEVTLTLVETVSGRISGLDRAEAKDLDTLWEELEKVAAGLLAPLVEGARSTEGADLVTVRIRVRPEDAMVRLDDKTVCNDVPCSLRVAKGAHVFTARADLHEEEERRVVVDRDLELAFDLSPRPYNYFGMQDAAHGGHSITFGVAPADTRYKSVTVFDGFTFAELNPVVDLGFGGQVFGYRQASRGDSWSILGFGPVVRMGRLIVGADVQLLSFRPHSAKHGDGWLPGITARAELPLVNRREIRWWAMLVPTPTAGIDVWFHDLDYDQYQVWIGLSWLGGIGF